MMKILIGDGLLFFLYMFAAGGIGTWMIVKVITAVLCFLISGLVLGYLYLTHELMHRRSLWMVTACAAIIICLLVSLFLGYPCPPVVSTSAL